MAQYDVFLSHSSADKQAVEQLARRLVQAGVKPFLDKWHLIPGGPWQFELEAALADSATCAVFVGPNNLGPWQHEEMRAAISRRVREGHDKFRVIPVLLPGAERGQRSSLPEFLVATTWVEFRKTLDDAEAFRRFVCGIIGKAPGPSPDEPLFEGRCPYKGLRFFDVDDAPFFQGREALTEWLMDKLRPSPVRPDSARLLVIVGASGSGKSSLARAGLVAAIKRGELEGSLDWPRLILRPGPNPLESLAIALCSSLKSGSVPSAVQDLIDSLRQRNDTLHITARLALAQSPSQRRVLFLVDQFEEVFTLCEKEDLRHAFIGNLLHAARVAQGQCIIVLTMRADFYGKCAFYPELAAALSDHQFLVGPMTEEELRRAIDLPAKLAGGELEPGLTERLVQAMKDERGALPLLQHTLLDLWERREGRRLTAEMFDKLGGLRGALERRANEVLDQFTPEEREFCRRIFLRLVQPGEGTEDSKRRARLRELRVADAPADRIESIVQRLADSRLIITDGDQPLNAEVFAEVAHEALIRDWTVFRKWIDADRAGLRIHTRLREAAAEWQATGPDDPSKRDPTYLYHGVRLAVAREWVAVHATELNALETEFLATSFEAERQDREDELEIARRMAAESEARRKAEEERAKEAELRREAEAQRAAEAEKRERDQASARGRLRRWFQATAVFAALALCATFIAIYSYLQVEPQRKRAVSERIKADRQARIATAQALAAQANEVREQYPERSLLLSTEAVQLSLRAGELPTAAAHQALRDGLSAIGGTPFGPCDHSYRGAVLSPDSRWLATANENATELWDATNPNRFPITLRKHSARRDARGFSDSVGIMAFSPDSRWLATKTYDDSIWLFEVNPQERKTGRVMRTSVPALTNVNTGRASQPIGRVTDRPPRITSLAFSPDGRWLAAGGPLSDSFPGNVKSIICLWELSTFGKSSVPKVLRSPGGAFGVMMFSPDSRWLATGRGDFNSAFHLGGGDPIPSVFVWDLGLKDSSEPRIVSKKEKTGGVVVPTFSNDSRWLVTGCVDGSVQIWDLHLGDPKSPSRELSGGPQPIEALAFSSTGHWLTSMSWQSQGRIWAWDPSVSTNKSTQLTVHTSLNRILFSKDDQMMAAWDDDGNGSGFPLIHVWDLEAKPPPLPKLLRGHEKGIVAAAFATNGRSLAAATREGRTRRWNLGTTTNIIASAQATTSDQYRSKLAKSSDGRWIASISERWQEKAQLTVWDSESASSEKALSIDAPFDSSVEKLALSSHGRWLAVSDFHGDVWLWDLKARDRKASQQKLLNQAGMGLFDSLVFSENELWFAIPGRDGISVFGLPISNPERPSVRLQSGGFGFEAVTFSHSARWLAAADSEPRNHKNKVILVDLKAVPSALSPRTVFTEYGEHRFVSLAFCSDDRWIAASSWSGSIYVSAVSAAASSASPRILRGPLKQHLAPLAISPDGDWVAAGFNTNVLVWALTPTQSSSYVTLRGHKGVSDLKFRKDPEELIGTSTDGTVEIWPMRFSELYNLARAVAGRNLSKNEWNQYLPGEEYREVFPGLPVPKE